MAYNNPGMRGFTSVPAQYSTAGLSEMVVAKIRSVLNTPVAPFPTLEAFFFSYFRGSFEVVRKQDFAFALQSLGVPPEQAQPLAEQLAAKDPSQMVSLRGFCSLFVQLTSPPAVPVSVTPTMPQTYQMAPMVPSMSMGMAPGVQMPAQTVQADPAQMTYKVLQAIAGYMGERQLGTVTGVFRVKTEFGSNVVDAFEVNTFLSSNFPFLNSQEVSSFFNAFRSRVNPNLVDAQSLDSALSGLRPPAPVQAPAPTYEQIMDRIRQSAAASFSDVLDSLRASSSDRTDFVSYPEFELGLKRLRAEIPPEHLQPFFMQIARGPRLSCSAFARELEEQSVRKAGVSIPPALAYVFQQIRAGMKQTPNHLLLFRDVARYDQTGLAYLTPFDLRNVLGKLRVTLPESTFFDLQRTLDPTGSQQIGYLSFIDRLGYVQSETAFQPPSAFPQPGGAMYGSGTGAVPSVYQPTVPAPIPISQSQGVQRKLVINAFLSEVAAASKARHMDPLLVFQQYDTTKESNVPASDVEPALARLATFPSAQLDAATVEFASRHHPGKFDYVRLVRAVEEYQTVAPALDSAFAVFEKKMAENSLENLYGLLGKWDLRNARTFAPADVEDIFATLCKTKLKETELAAIVRRYDVGAGTADFLLIEGDYKDYLKRKETKETSPQGLKAPKSSLELVFAALRDGLAAQGKAAKLADVLSKHDVVSGFMKSASFQSAIRSICKEKVSARTLEEATKLVANAQGEVDVFDFEHRFEKFKSESGSAAVTESQRTLGALADILIESKLNLSNALYERDTQHAKALPKDVVQKVLTSTLKLDREIQTALSQLLVTYEKARTGNIVYEQLLDDIAKVTKERQTMISCLSQLKAHLGIHRIRLEELLQKADPHRTRLLGRDQIVRVVEQTHFHLENLPAALNKVFDSLLQHPGGKIDYGEFWKKVQTAPTYQPGTERMDEMLDCIRKAVSQGKHNVQELFAGRDSGRGGKIDGEKFIDALKEIGLERHKEVDLVGLCKHYEDPQSGGLVIYTRFLSDIAGTSAPTAASKKKINMSDSALEELAVVLYSIKKNVPAYFAPYGLNPATWTFHRSQFAQGMNDLRLGMGAPEIEQLASSLDPQFDGTVSLQELHREVEQKTDGALEKFCRHLCGTVKDCMAARRVTDLNGIMRKHDWNNSKEVPVGKFEEEMQPIVGGSLSQMQFAFVFSKYATRPGMINYENFIQDVTRFSQAADTPISPLVDRLREQIRLRKLTLVKKLSDLDTTRSLSFNVTTLIEIFPKDMFSAEDYASLRKIIDEGQTNKFSFDKFCELFWTSREEEEEKEASPTIRAASADVKVRNFCSARAVDLRSLLARLDRDRSGYVSPTEIRQVLDSSGLKLGYYELVCMMYHQGVITDSQFRKNYTDLLAKIQAAARPTTGAEEKPQATTAPAARAKIAPEMVQAQENMQVRLVQEILLNNAELLTEFRKEDAAQTCLLAPDEFFAVLDRTGITIQPEERQTVLDLPGVLTGEHFMVSYKEFINGLHEFAQSKFPKIPSTLSEDWKELNPTQGESKTSGLVEVTLSSDDVMNVVSELKGMRHVLEQKGINIQKEFGKNEKGGYIELEAFFDVLRKAGIDVTDETRRRLIYSYLKHEKAGKISVRRLFDTMLFGKQLQQQKSWRLRGHEKSMRNALLASGVHIRRLREYMRTGKHDNSIFTKNAVEGKVLTREGLIKAFQDMHFECSADEFEHLFRSIDLKSDGNGSLPHLFTLLKGKQEKKEEKKTAKMDAKVKSAVDSINNQLKEKKITLNTFCKTVDASGDGYVDKDEFVNGTGKLVANLGKELLGQVFDCLNTTGYNPC